MGRKIFGVTAGTAKLQQGYARDSVNMSAERNQLLEVKSIYTSFQKSSLKK